jgi:hypothetical protein
MLYFTFYIIKIDCDFYNIIPETKANERKRTQTNAMDSYFNTDGSIAYHKFTNVEFSGVFGEDYHFFIKYEDKVYMEVKGIGEIVITFAELQKNKYWKQYYDLSLLLTNNKHSLAEDTVYSSKNTNYSNAYKEARFWSIHTAFMENETISEGYVCYYKINPYDLVGMKYTSTKNLDLFKQNYANTRDDFINVKLDIYSTLAKEYQANQE